MKKNIIFLGALLLSSAAYSQVGINNEAPRATLDVTAKTTDGTRPEGIIAPRLTGDQIKSGDAQYDTAQIGTIVYATSAVGGTPAGKTINITSAGYYYFNGSLWTKFGSGSSASGAEPWYNQADGTPATANTQNIYQTGKVAINTPTTNKQFEVKGDVKALAIDGTTYSGLETNNSSFGLPVNMVFSADNPNVIAATKAAMVSTSINEAALSTQGVNGNSSVGATIIPTVGPKSEMTAGNTTTNIVNRIVVGSNGETEQTDRIILRSENIPASTATRVLVDKAEGVTFKYGSIANPSGNYTFPQNNGTAGQVLVTNGAAPALMTGAQLSWQNVSNLVAEPWFVQNTTNGATANTQNIYQAGNVSIGSQTPIAPFTSNSVTITPKLSVTGNVATTGSYYTTTGKYADYVFEDYFDGTSKIDETYKFRSLEETAAYIKENKHLPGVTSIKDILKTDNGYTVNLSELSIQQLEKIEELYLHTIEQQEEIAKQKTEVNDLRSRIEKLEQLLVKENNNK